MRNYGATNDSVPGLGNLVVGYNEVPLGELSVGDRGGSHNLIVGQEHKYSSFGGLVAGLRNTISGNNSTVRGGNDNTASGPTSSVSGGFENLASGFETSVSGGFNHTASGDFDWVAESLFEDF